MALAKCLNTLFQYLVQEKVTITNVLKQENYYHFVFHIQNESKNDAIFTNMCTLLGTLTKHKIQIIYQGCLYEKPKNVFAVFEISNETNFDEIAKQQISIILHFNTPIIEVLELKEIISKFKQPLKIKNSPQENFLGPQPQNKLLLMGLDHFEKSFHLQNNIEGLRTFCEDIGVKNVEEIKNKITNNLL